MKTKKKYQKLVFSGFKEEMKLPFIAPVQAYFRGAHQIPGAGINMGWQLFTKPILLETEAHTHEADEYLVWLGGDPADFFGSWDAVIEIYLGEGDDMEKYIIDKPTIIYIPPNLSHNPMEFKVVNKPVLFTALLQQPLFTKMMGGKEYKWKGPGAKGNTKGFR
jgi:hypothetical protein